MDWQRALVNYSYHYPLRVMLLVLLMVMLALTGVSRINLDINFNDYFTANDERFIGIQQLDKQFDRQDQLLLLLEAQNSWQQEALTQSLVKFVEQLQQQSVVSRVGGYAEFLSSDASQTVLAYKRHPRLDLVRSENDQAILLAIELNREDRADFSNQTLWREHHIDWLEQWSQDFWQPQHVGVYLSGRQALNWQYAKVLQHDLRWFAPGLVMVLVLMAGVCIRSRAWLIAIACNIVLTLVATIGLAGWFNLTIAAISAFIPVVITTLALAYSAHLYISWLQAPADVQQLGHQNGLQQKHQHSQLTKLVGSFSHNRLPLMYATITTLVGFALLSLSPSPPIQTFGMLVAIAVTLHYVLCHTMLVAVIKLMPNAKDKGDNLTESHCNKVPSAPILLLGQYTHRLNQYSQRLSWRGLLLSVSLVTLLAMFSVVKLQFNDDPFSYFNADNPFSQSHSKLQQHFYGINTLHYQLPVGEQQIYDKAYLSFIYQFGRFLKQQPQVNKVTHIGDWVKSAGMTQSQFKRITEQYDVSELGLQSEVSIGYQSSLVTVYLAPLTAQQMVAFEASVNQWLQANKGQMDVSPALSTHLLFAHLCIDNAKSMLASFAVALVLLALMLGIAKRSARYGLVGLLLNVLPLIWVFGLWQLLGGYISIGSAVVLGVMFGIIVDDTLHLLLKLPPMDSEKQTLGAEFWQPFSQIIAVVTFTTVTLLLGFGLGLMSDFGPITELSLLSCLVIALAWLFDVVVLPAVYRIGER